MLNKINFFGASIAAFLLMNVGKVCGMNTQENGSSSSAKLKSTVSVAEDQIRQSLVEEVQLLQNPPRLALDILNAILKSREKSRQLILIYEHIATRLRSKNKRELDCEEVENKLKNINEAINKDITRLVMFFQIIYYDVSTISAKFDNLLGLVLFEAISSLDVRSVNNRIKKSPDPFFEQASNIEQLISQANETSAQLHQSLTDEKGLLQNMIELSAKISSTNKQAIEASNRIAEPKFREKARLNIGGGATTLAEVIQQLEAVEDLSDYISSQCTTYSSGRDNLLDSIPCAISL